MQRRIIASMTVVNQQHFNKGKRAIVYKNTAYKNKIGGFTLIHMHRNK